ncbi:sodium-dependent proline transporter-like [Haliotis rubra]|uniref:sodium-dependent proline transporter-like n=1 Tax=Haliotis rubra TaxID=36100 RepID=UPI001EE5E267|nr:sodium-dependent proline transporter-like [Haliotis rubra]
MASDKEVEIERGTWSKKLDFILSCVGFSVGLGNIWRFPYVVYRNGGATFLIPYLIMLVIAGLPLYFMELAVGQFASEGPVTVWKVSPIFTGIGIAMVTISTMICVYYNIIITYAMYYLFVSLVNLDLEVPWATCTNTWNTHTCRTEAFPDLTGMNESAKLHSMYEELYNSTCVSIVSSNSTWLPHFDSINSTMLSDSTFDSCKFVYTSASEEYWTRSVLRLHESTGIHDLGDVSVKLLITLILAWILIFFCLLKGIKSSGKVVYFTATFPFIILLILLIRGLTLPGYEKGIQFYVVPKPEKLREARVWGEAATQIFYSLGVGFGALPTMSSYNKFHNNCYRDAIVVAVINCSTSIFAGFAIFSLLGFMAYTTNQEIADVVDQGPGLTFIAYPEGLARLPQSSFWAFLFFFMILTVGLDSQFAMMEAVISGVSDIHPQFFRKNKAAFTFFCCAVGFLLGIPQVTTGGIYVLTLMDWYCGNYNLMIVALAEIICLMYVYGIQKFRADIEMMIGHKPNVYWMATWFALTPATILFIIIIASVENSPARYGDYTFPPWAQGVGWVMVSLPVLLIIIVAIVQIKRYGFKNSWKPTSDWGPANPEYRTGRYARDLDDSLTTGVKRSTYAISNSVYSMDEDEGVKGDNQVNHPNQYKMIQCTDTVTFRSVPPPDYSPERLARIQVQRL